jgi:hypothetical protein
MPVTALNQFDFHHVLSRTEGTSLPAAIEAALGPATAGGALNDARG